MTSFEHLYQSLFPQVAQDRITNYTFVRTIRPASSRNATQIDLVRPKQGPVTRHFGLGLCILKSIPVVHDDSVSQNRVLREVAVHRAITLGSNPIDERTLPLLSHFISYSIPGKDLKEEKVKSRISHPYVVLVLPYCKKGTLAQYFSQRFAPSTTSPKSDGAGTLSEKELRWTILEVIKALNRCHERGIVHRDIKAENILLWDSSQAKGEKGLLRLLLCDFGLSTWTDEEIGQKEDDQGDSTLCGTWDYLSPETVTQRRTGPSVDVWALGCLCVFLLTGFLPFSNPSQHSKESSSSDVRVEAQSLYEKVERLAVGNWEEIREKLPHHLSYDCRAILEGMLQDEKCRLSVQEILAHPFIKPTLVSIPLRTLRKEKEEGRVVKEVRPTKARGDKEARHIVSPTTPQPLQEAENSKGSTTLRSVMQHVSPGMFDKIEEGKHEQRKTPFGMVKVARQKSGETKMIEEGSNSKESLALPTMKELWGNGYGTRGLLSVKQRLQGGKIELTKQGSVTLTKGEASIVISSNGRLCSVLSDHGKPDRIHVEELYKEACEWLNRHRRRSTLAGFMLGTDPDFSVSRHCGAVEYTAYCSIKANGPLPDYQVRFAAVEGSDTKEKEKKVDEWNVEVEVHVQRHCSNLLLRVKVQAVSKQKGMSWKECSLPISNLFSFSDMWALTSNNEKSLLLQDLSKREIKAIDRSLEASSAVDSVFKTLIRG